MNQKEVYQKIGQRIRCLRKLESLNQQDLADILGLTRTSVVNIESGTQRSLVHTLFDLADIFSVDVVDLLPESTDRSLKSKIIMGLEEENSKLKKENIELKLRINRLERLLFSINRVSSKVSKD